jgi:hypothetical protein
LVYCGKVYDGTNSVFPLLELLAAVVAAAAPAAFGKRSVNFRRSMVSLLSAFPRVVPRDRHRTPFIMRSRLLLGPLFSAFPRRVLPLRRGTSLIGVGTLGSGRVLCLLLLELLAAVAAAAAVGSGLGELRFRQGAELIFEATDCDLASLVAALVCLSEIASQNSATAAGLTSLAGASASAGSAAAEAAALLLPRVLRRALSGRLAVAAQQPVPGAGATRTWHCRLPSGSTCSDLPCERGFRLIWICPSPRGLE